jgi:hypothetical protein
MKTRAQLAEALASVMPNDVNTSELFLDIAVTIYILNYMKENRKTGRTESELHALATKDVVLSVERCIDEHRAAVAKL